MGSSAHRFIPTGVGNTHELPAPWTTGTVHPHRRGEHLGLILLTGCFSRFIPTGVGNTSTALVIVVTAAVHPHRRGEHFPIRTLREPSNGSSPQAWGTQKRGLINIEQKRFIPTGVGNTC